MRHRLRVLSFAVASLSRHWLKSLVVVSVYALLVSLVVSLLLFVDTLDEQAKLLLDGAPEIVVQRLQGGRHELIPSAWAEPLASIRGVVGVQPRVWGYTFDPLVGVTWTLWGADSLPPGTLEPVVGSLTELEGGKVCVVGEGVAELRFLGVGDRMPLKGAGGELFAPRVVGIFATSSALLTNDLVVLPTPLLRRVLAMQPELNTDLAVAVANPSEVDTVARKILATWPDVRVITKEQILATYSAVFNWRGGVWIGLLMSAVLAFAILVWDKASGLSAEEYRTIGILKAVGWNTREVLALRLWEGAIVSLSAVLTGVLVAQLHLVLFHGSLFAAVMKGWSVLYPPFEPAPSLHSYVVLASLPLAVLPYLAASLVPAWRASIIDPDSVIRGAP